MVSVLKQVAFLVLLPQMFGVTAFLAEAPGSLVLTKSSSLPTQDTSSLNAIYGPASHVVDRPRTRVDTSYLDALKRRVDATLHKVEDMERILDRYDGGAYGRSNRNRRFGSSSSSLSYPRYGSDNLYSNKYGRDSYYNPSYNSNWRGSSYSSSLGHYPRDSSYYYGTNNRRGEDRWRASSSSYGDNRNRYGLNYNNAYNNNNYGYDSYYDNYFPRSNYYDNRWYVRNDRDYPSSNVYTDRSRSLGSYGSSSWHNDNRYGWDNTHRYNRGNDFNYGSSGSYDGRYRYVNNDRQLNYAW